MQLPNSLNTVKPRRLNSELEVILPGVWTDITVNTLVTQLHKPIKQRKAENSTFK